MTRHSTPDEPDDDVPVDVVDRVFERAKTPVRHSFRARPKRWAICSLALLLLVAGSTIGLTVRTGEDAAEAKVRQYLEAIRAGDVARAEAMLDWGYRDPDSRAPLGLEFMDPDWTVESVSSYYPPSGLVDARVATVIRSGAGDEYSFDMELTRDSDSEAAPWLISNGLIQLVMRGPAELSRINGEAVGDEYADDNSFLLFPGLYRFGHDLEDLVDARWQQRLMGPGTHWVSVTGQRSSKKGRVDALGFTAAGEETAQQAIDTHIDECVSEGEAVTIGCPFGVSPVHKSEGEMFGPDDLEDVEWEILEYPRITVVEDGNGFQYADREPGTARLTATATSDDTTIDIDQECRISTGKLRITGADSGDPLIEPEEDGFPEQWGTC